MALPSLTELGLLGQHAGFQYTPWWTTLDGHVDDDVFQGESLNKTTESRPRKRRALSPDDRDKSALSLDIPDDEDVPELEESADSLDESSPESSPEPSPQPSPQTSPETATADLALPIHRLLPPHYLLPLPLTLPLPLPLPTKAVESAQPTHITHITQPSPKDISTTSSTGEKRKRDAPPRLAMANLLSPTPHVYCLYKYDRVDQLGGKRRGMRA